MPQRPLAYWGLFGEAILPLYPKMAQEGYMELLERLRDYKPSIQAKLTEKNESHTTVEIRLFGVNVIGVWMHEKA